VSTILNRALFQQYALGYDSHVHRKLTLTIEQHINDQDLTLKTTYHIELAQI
jgi:hypothetical protein